MEVLCTELSIKTKGRSGELVTYACNPSNSGGKCLEDQNSKPAPTNTNIKQDWWNGLSMSALA
jgi:hypothetical protein